MPTGPTLGDLADDLAANRTSARRLTEICLEQIERKNKEAGCPFVHVDTEGALSAANAVDKLRSSNAAPSRFAGIPVSIKDLFDVQGQTTRAGSFILDGPAAREDAPSVARLRKAGFILIGRTNMTEFAYSGLGLNPHFGTPLSPWRRREKRIAGGSTSGGAVSVSDGMAHAALGTDTGGSCRIPAAFTGLVGFKSAADSIPTEGIIPLSQSLDSVGVIARSVSCCAALNGVLTQSQARDLGAVGLSHLVLGSLENYVCEDMEPAVATAYEEALSCLSAAGARIESVKMPDLESIPKMSAKGGFPAAESYAWHGELMKERNDEYDPRVVSRIEKGGSQTAADYADLQAWRRELISGFEQRMIPFHALIAPAVPILPPRLEDLEDDDEYSRINLLVLRNLTIVNLVDGCSFSIPIPAQNDAPVGLMLAADRNRSAHLFQAAFAIEKALRR